ncbi:PEP-CTERM sorting domain-containing protein [Aquabacterium sp. A7-Y]|uniref:PEP-CTERM sorting domain-containing protein n=1 Tax=Aquabacterium sp. A7-Y TaxID=1349605 RepID=UPI00223D0E71|nr:PEP-CTERM sorting domain-containing protein [Aquabacterium sp. A7-Y]MCW7539715.1 PEP-CTERM sorting domain-containing protein [Aquabacterium sp. A7-Y]
MKRFARFSLSAIATAFALLAPIGSAQAGIYLSTGEPSVDEAQYQDGQYYHWITVAHDAKVVNQGGDFGYFGAYDESHVVLQSGDLDTYGGHEQSSMEMSGGTVSWMELTGSAQASISGGSISTLYRSGEARLTIFGRDLKLENNLLSGVWSDGSSFSFSLFDGSPYQQYSVSLDYVSLVSLAPVPEPETYALMALGLGMLGVAVKKRRRASGQA